MVLRVLSGFAPGEDGEAAKSRDLTLSLLAWSPEPFARTTFNPGHVTCTGLVLSPRRRRVLLVHHRRLNRWLLPGGHVEDTDASPGETARREVAEETGADLEPGVPPQLVGVDVHPIPSNHREPLHLHHDLIFAFHAVSKRSACSEEAREIAWCRLDEFDRYAVPGNIRRATERALREL